jgi:hypothetical protein
MKNTLLISALLLISNLLQAQSLKQYVPLESTFVLGINWGTLTPKISFDEFNELNENIGSDLLFELMANITKNPAEYGLDLKEQTFLFHHLADTIDNRVLVLGIADKAKFQANIEEWLTMKFGKPNFVKNGAFLSYGNGSFTIHFNKETAVFIKGKEEYFRSQLYGQKRKERRELERKIDQERQGITIEPTEGEAIIEVFEDIEEEEEEMPMLEWNDDDEIADVPEVEEITEDEIFEVIEMDEDVDYDSPIMVEETEDDYDYEEYAVEEAVEAVSDYDYYDYDNHPLIIAFEKKWDSKMEKERADWDKNSGKRNLAMLNRYLKLNGDQLASSNSKFQKVMNNEHDLSFWLNPGVFNLFANQSMKNMYRYRMDDMETPKLGEGPTRFEKLMDGNYSYAHGDFNQGSFVLTTYQENNDVVKQFQMVNTGKGNTDFLKYIKSSTFGLYSMDFNIPNIFEFYREFMFAALESFPMERNVSGYFEMMDLLINKDLFYNSFAGDAVIALTGITTNIGSNYRYVYDEETFDGEYKMVTDTTLVPELLIAATIKKKENIDAVVHAFERMGLLNSVKENVYQVLEEPRSKSTGFFIAMYDNKFFVTNDSALVYHNLENGWAKADQLVGTARDMMSKHANLQFWNSEKSFDAVLAIAKDFRPKEKSKIQVLQRHLSDSYSYVDEMENGVIRTNTYLNFSDGSTNSLSELMQLITELGLLE